MKCAPQAAAGLGPSGRGAPIDVEAAHKNFEPHRLSGEDVAVRRRFRRRRRGVWTLAGLAAVLAGVLFLLALAVPGWLDSHRLPKAVAVVRALKMMARVRLDCRMLRAPDRQAITH